MSLKDLLNPIKSELKELNSLLKNELTASHEPKIKEIGTHLSTATGKQVRAALTILSHHLISPPHTPQLVSESQPSNLINLAAGIECLHLASLIHDDIIDEADTRRNIATVSKKWGTNPALVSGVYVYAIALDLITQTQNHDIISRISQTVKVLCEGEVHQMFNRHEVKSSIDEYLDTIAKKTAVLFEGACYCGASLADASETDKAKLAEFGKNLGMIFQITDDYLDLFGDGEYLAKTPGQDIIQGEYTLPFYYILETLQNSEKDALIKKIHTGSPDALTTLQSHFNKEIKIKTQTALETYLNKAKNNLDDFPESNYKKMLIKIIDLIAERCFIVRKTPDKQPRPSNLPIPQLQKQKS